MEHAFRKRSYYEYEKELRAVVMEIPESVRGQEFADQVEAAKKLSAAIDIQVNLHELIHEVHISPGRPRWFHRLVTDALGHYGLNVTPSQSFLDKLPTYQR